MSNKNIEISNEKAEGSDIESAKKNTALDKGGDTLSKILGSSGDIGFIWNIDRGTVKWLGDIHTLMGIKDGRDIAFGDINQRINPQDLPCLLYTSPSPRDRG